MSFYDPTPQHRADSSVAAQRRVFAGSITDAAAVPALRRANRRMRARRLSFDATIALAVAAFALVVLLTLHTLVVA